jgi:DNA polymerase V
VIVGAPIALVDCNNFYASCGRMFQPRLRGKPVVVLSNNDGCVIARSNEAKSLGVEMGAPWHLCRESSGKRASWCVRAIRGHQTICSKLHAKAAGDWNIERTSRSGRNGVAEFASVQT